MRNLRNLLLLVAAVAAVNLIVSDRFYTRILILTLLWASAATAWNITAKAGQISLGHSVFTGIGAYTFVLLLREFDLTPWLGMPAGMAVAAVAAVIIGLPTFRLKGFYFTLASMAFPLILMLLVIYWGYPEVTVPFHPESPWLYMQFRDPSNYVWLALGLLVVTLAVSVVIDRTRFGEALRAIRDNEVLAKSIGVRTELWKLAAFAISAALCAAMAVIWVNSVLFVVAAEEVFSLGVVVLMLSVAFVGGVTRTWAPLAGAVLLIPLGQILLTEVGERLPGAETLVYGVALVVVAVVAPAGLVPKAETLLRRLADRRAPTPIPVPAATDTAPPAIDVPPAAATRRHLRPAESATLLSVSGVKKRFGGMRVLTDVAFEVRAGARVGLIGPNGAGKTTLFNVVCGHLRADAGAVEFEGRDVSRASPATRFKMGMARTFQVPQGFPRMTPRENVLVAAIGSGRHADAETATSSALEAVGLTTKADEDLVALTTIEVKLLELARSIVSQPRLLLLDEPLAGLSEVERERFFRILEEVTDDGTGVLIIEHSVRSLVRFVDELVALDHGVIVASGSPEHVTSDPGVIEAYLGTKWQPAPVPGTRATERA